MSAIARGRRGQTSRPETPEETGTPETPEGTEETGTPETPEGTEEGEKSEGTEKEAEKDPFAVLDEAASIEEFVRTSARVDREATTPPRVKSDLQKSFNGFKPKTVDGEIIPNKGEALWLTQKFPTAVMATQYLDFARKYAAFKDWTLRSVWMSETAEGTLVRSKEQTKILRFCVKTKEVRNAS